MKTGARSLHKEGMKGAQREKEMQGVDELCLSLTV